MQLPNVNGRKAALLLCVLCAASSAASAQFRPVVSKAGVGIDQKLNAPIPLSLVSGRNPIGPSPFANTSARSQRCPAKGLLTENP